jgi:sugar phosphate isomerase/epimerase
MPAPIGLQLYTVRDALAADFVGVIKTIADMGFVGVEAAGQFGESVESAVSLFKDLGLQVLGAHSALPVGDNASPVIDTIAALGAPYLICPWIDPENFTSEDKIRAVADQLNAAAEVGAANGFKIAYHNHWFEYTALPDGRIPNRILMEHTVPDVVFEIDTYWVKVGGQDPAAEVALAGARAPLLHIKDGPGAQDQPMVAVGEGIMDFAAVAAASGSHAEWMIVELDRAATDMIEAVQKSYTYLTSKGLARGNKN